jgi:DNA-binding SARP family transcriptional activator
MPQPLAQLQLLGGARLIVAGMPHILERKTAGLLAYLALSGSQPRSVLAGLLWANVTENHARNNLRQCLFRLKRLALVVVGNSHLELRDTEVDILHIEQQATLGEFAPWTFVRGQLLDGYSFDDCPDFDEWLHHNRERLLTTQSGAFLKLLHTSPKSLYLEIAERWLETMPLATDALKAVLDAHLAQGTPESARRVMAAFQTRHRLEFGVERPQVWEWLSSTAHSAQDLVEAAAHAKDSLQNAQAAHLYMQAADAFAAEKNLSAECDALQQAFDLLDNFDHGVQQDQILDRLAGVARTPTQVLRWRLSQAVLAHQRAQWQTALHHAKQVAKLAARKSDRQTELNALGYMADSYLQLGQLEDAARAFETVLQKSKTHNDPEEICAALTNMAYVRGVQQQPQVSVRLLLEALEVAESAGVVVQQLAILNQLTFYQCREHLTDALEYSKRALALHRHISGQVHELARSHKFFGDIQATLGHYTQALSAYQTALELTESANLPNSYLYRSQAVVLTTLGDFAAAQAALQTGFAKTNKNRSDEVALTSSQLYLWRLSGKATMEKLERLVETWSVQQIEELDRFELERSFLLSGQARIEFVQQYMRKNTIFGDYFLALAYLANHQPELALPLTEVLIQRLQHCQSGIYPPAIMLVHADALAALGDTRAEAILEQAKKWVLEKASVLPKKIQRKFLEQNPYNRRLVAPVKR